MAKYKSVVTINVSVFLLMLGVGMIVALLPQRIINLSGSASSVGYLASAFALPYVLLQIPVGNFSDKFGYKPFLVGGYLLCSLTGLLYYFSHTSNLFFLARGLQGVGEVPIWALAPALLSIQYPAQKGKIMGIYNACLHLGLTSGSLLGILVEKTWQGREAFFLFAGVSFLGAVLIVLFVDAKDEKSIVETTKIDWKELVCLIDNPITSIIFAGIMLYGAGYGIFISIIPAFLISVKHCQQTMVGIFFVFFYIALSLAQLIAGPFSDRHGRKPAMVCGLLMAAMGIAAFWACKPFGLIGLLTVASFGLGVYCVSAMAYLNESVSRSLKGTISGAFYFFWGAGYFLGPLMLGKMGRSNHWEMGFLFLAGVFLLELLLFSIVIDNIPKGFHHK